MIAKLEGYNSIAMLKINILKNLFYFFLLEINLAIQHKIEFEDD
jgi:hypothetical protein